MVAVPYAVSVRAACMNETGWSRERVLTAAFNAVLVAVWLVLLRQQALLQVPIGVAWSMGLATGGFGGVAECKLTAPRRPSSESRTSNWSQVDGFRLPSPRVSLRADVAGAFRGVPMANSDLPSFGDLHDDSLYYVSAKSLADGGGYRIESLPGEPAQTKYPPLYPLLLSLAAHGGPAVSAQPADRRLDFVARASRHHASTAVVVSATGNYGLATPGC